MDAIDIMEAIEDIIEEWQAGEIDNEKAIECIEVILNENEKE